MPTTILAVVFTLAGLLLASVVLVFLLAGGANSTPAWITATKAMLWALLLPCAAALVVVPAALFTSRPPLALTASLLPALAAVLIFATIWELNDASIDRAWSVPWPRAALRLTIVLAAATVALYLFHQAATPSPAPSTPRRWLTLCLTPLAPVLAHYAARLL